MVHCSKHVVGTTLKYSFYHTQNSVKIGSPYPKQNVKYWHSKKYW